MADSNETYEFAYAGLPAIPFPPMRIRLILGTSLLLQSIFVVVAYTLVLVTVKRNWEHLNKKGTTWYILVVNLAVGDLGLVLVIILVGVPVCYAAYPVYGPLATEILANLDTLSFHLMFLGSIGMALSRFLSFVWEPGYQMFFTRPKIYFTLALFWFLSFVAVLVYNLVGNPFRCRKWFHPTGFFFNYFCAPDSPDWVLTYVSVVAKVELATPMIVFLLYIILFLRIYIKSQNSVIPAAEQQQTKQNRRMLLQSFLITIVLALQLATFWLFPTLVGGYVASYATNTATIGNSVINPIVYLVFNPVLRGKVKLLLGMKVEAGEMATTTAGAVSKPAPTADPNA